MRKRFQHVEKIFQENNGVLRTSQAIKKGIDSKTLYEMVDAGILKKEGRGIYRLANLPPLSNPDLVQIALRVPNSVICLISALSFHDLTTQTPYKIYIAIPKNSKKPQIDYPPIEAVKLSEQAYCSGIDVHNIDGIDVKIYDKEKTVADCFKFRNKIGQDIAIEALKDYLGKPGRDIEKLLHYARIDRVEKVIRPYIEAIV
jgi:predicted transcriptional regulator of viral defense system